jgi:CRP-like cAMP-binding protein
MDRDKISAVLRKCEVFGELSDKELESIAELGKIERFRAGESIYSQGSLGEKLYVLCDGEVTLERTVDIGGRRKANVPVFIHRATPFRRLIGGWSAVVGVKHLQMCSAICYKPTTVVSIGCSEFREIISKDVEIKVKILESLVLLLRDRIASSYEAMETL